MLGAHRSCTNARTARCPGGPPRPVLCCATMPATGSPLTGSCYWPGSCYAPTTCVASGHVRGRRTVAVHSTPPVSEEAALAQALESALAAAQQRQQRPSGMKLRQKAGAYGNDASGDGMYDSGYDSDGYLDDGDGAYGTDEKERVFLVGATLKGSGPGRGRYVYDVHESLEELGRLAETAGLRVMGSTYQVLEAPNMATYIGSGKVNEVSRAVAALDVDTVIFDDELSPGQLRNLEKALAAVRQEQQGEGAPPVRVCDRTALILDIFSQRAQTREGQLQVELAQTEYQLPRLTRMWTHLDRVGGGGQVKGAGEKQIEIDKRLLRDKAAQLRRELESVRHHRRQYRDKRSATPIPVVGMCGYTNAGKSTLLNTLTGAGVLAEDQLFATLDPTTRRLRLKGNKEILISDTVGFIQKLPTELVAAFRATLEEIQDASIILHVLDISHPAAAAQNEAVMGVLRELGVEHIPIVTAWNKIDACAQPEEIRRIAAKRERTVCVSGHTGEGLEELLACIGRELEAAMLEVTAVLPYAAGDLLSALHTSGRVREVEYAEEGVRVAAAVPGALLGRLRPYLVGEVPEVPERGKGAGGKGRGREGKGREGTEEEEDGWDDDDVVLL